jgi:hypothetical protein
MPLTQVSPGLLDSNAQYYGFKNRIINPGMVIDQRNNGASVTPADNAYTLDRWKSKLSQSSKYSVQRSTTAPAGFVNSLAVTSLSAYSITSSDRFGLQYPIEGLNCTDLGFGTANASTVTLSFWVRSSLTGTFGGAFFNDGANRSYPFTYTISAANTWEQKSITIAGDTTGTWKTDNTVGLYIEFSLGTGSTLSGTAGSWASGFYPNATGATSVVGTNGATFYITGVQLEKGSTATSFDYRPYTTELQLCMRYYENIQVTQNYYLHTTSGPVMNCTYFFAVPKRSAPTITVTVDQAPTNTGANISGVFFEKVGGSQNGQFTNVRAAAEL